MADKYCKFGSVPRNHSCMQCSYLLFIVFKVTSLTRWVVQLKINPFYAILSSFKVENTLGGDTYLVTSRRGKNVSAIAKKMASMIANAIVAFLNLTAISVGILPVTVFIMVMIYTCL